MAANQNQVPNMTTIDAFWNVYVGDMNIGLCSEITIPIALKSVIGQQGINIMVDRFRNIIEAPVTAIEELEQGTIKIVPKRNPLGHDSIIPGVQKPKPRTSTKAKIARPPNAFILYRQHHHPLVKAEYPELHNNQISVILGIQWKEESNTNKAQYAALASRLKARHLQEHPGYQYQPRKPSEKKRRMTRRNSSKTTSTSASMATSTPVLMEDQEDSSVPAAVNALANSVASSAADPAPVGNSGSVDINDNDRPSDDLTFSTTAGGNAVFNLGDENLEEDQLTTMLTNYNDSVTTATTQQAAISQYTATPVLYNEPTEDAQNDANFYSSVIDVAPVISPTTDFNEFFDFHAASLSTLDF